MSNSFATPWTVAHQASLSMGCPRQEYWSGLPFPCPGDLLESEIEIKSLNSGRQILYHLVTREIYRHTSKTIVQPILN